MEYFIAIDGAHRGPFNQYRVSEMLREGEVTGENLAWHRGMEKWAPIREIPSLEIALQAAAEAWADLDDDTKIAPGAEEFEKDAGDGGKGTGKSKRKGSAGPPDPGEPEDFPPRSPRGVGGEAVFPLPGEETGAQDFLRNTRPFARFWARIFDFLMVITLVMLFADVTMPLADPGGGLSDHLARYQELSQQPEWVAMAILLFLSLVVWHLVEALLLHVFGTTPGKWLFGVRVRADGGGHLPLGASLGRSVFVYVLGAGLYQFPFFLIAMGYGFYRLVTRGATLWDEQMRVRVEHSPPSPGRIFLAVAAFFALLILQSLKIS